MNTTVSTNGTEIYLNERPTYADLEGSNPVSHGLLFNARFVQGIFDDTADPQRFARFGFGTWDPKANTDRLIAALPQWYAHGLRAFTVGLQGGGPCFTMDNATIRNNPFGTDGQSFDPAYADRLDRLVRAADQLGMVAIVSFFYGAQTQHLTDGRAVRAAVRTASRFLREQGCTNVIIEVANEMNIGAFAGHPIIQEPEGMAALIDLARDESGGMLVGCSGGGGYAAREVVETSDVILIHGNGLSRGGYYNLITRCREWCPDKPIVCNEDSQAIGQLAVAAETHTSWGYYNNMSKQEPPTRWEILPGEDTYFASRVAELVGIPVPLAEGDDRFFLHGFEPEMTDGGQRWIRVGALRPEEIDMVRFFRNGEHYCTAYDEPFAVHARSNWFQLGALVSTGDTWEARIHLRHGEVVRTHAQVP